MQPLLNTAVKAARKAGDLIARYSNRVDTIRINAKNRNDLVTEIDQQAEQEIIAILRKAYPDHSILAEESGGDRDADHVWIIDPLDGTTNFVHGFPHYSVSIACLYKDRIEHGVIYDPSRQELFTASRGNGAQLDGKRIRVSNCRSLTGSLVATGFPFKTPAIVDTYLDLFKSVFIESSGARRAGSAALDLAYVAAGRLDGYWEIGLKPWDMAAGALLVQEAGGLISAFNGSDQYLFNESVVAATPRVHGQLLDKIHPHIGKFDEILNK